MYIVFSVLKRLFSRLLVYQIVPTIYYNCTCICGKTIDKEGFFNGNHSYMYNHGEHNIYFSLQKSFWLRTTCYVFVVRLFHEQQLHILCKKYFLQKYLKSNVALSVDYQHTVVHSFLAHKQD